MNNKTMRQRGLHDYDQHQQQQVSSRISLRADTTHLRRVAACVGCVLGIQGAIGMKKTYAYHKPSQQGLEQIAKLRQAFSDLHDTIEAVAPTSREKFMALTNLETTAMWAIKAVVCNDPQSEIQT